MQYTLGTSGQLRHSSWEKEAGTDIHLHLGALQSTTSVHLKVSLTFRLLSPFPTNCSEDFHNFSRSLGVVKGCLFTYSLLFLNSDSCQASPTPHCSHRLFRSELPGIPQELLKGTPLSHAAAWPVLICFLSHTASQFPQILLCSETNRATGQKEQSSTKLLHKLRKTFSSWLASSHGLSCNWLWPRNASWQSHWEPTAWCSSWDKAQCKLELVDWGTRTRWRFSYCSNFRLLPWSHIYWWPGSCYFYTGSWHVKGTIGGQQALKSKFPPQLPQYFLPSHGPEVY